jgi:hypothetical protein
MTIMGREDSFLSGGRERVDAILKVASERVTCVRKSHEVTIAQLPPSGACPVCKKEGRGNVEVVLKSEVAETDASNRRELAKAGYDVEPEQEPSKGGKLNMMKSDEVATGGSIDWGHGPEPIVTKREGNPRRGLWTGTR